MYCAAGGQPEIACSTDSSSASGGGCCAPRLQLCQREITRYAFKIGDRCRVRDRFVVLCQDRYSSAGEFF